MRSWVYRLRGNPAQPDPKETAAQVLRDTDRDWRIIGENDPYHGVLTDPRFHRKNLNDENLALFFESGAHDVGHWLQRSREIFGEFHPRSALDFGCGVGRLTRPLAALTGDAVGVDISQGMLNEARRTIIPGAQFVERIPARVFDWVVSYIVLQHVTPEAGYSVVADLLDAVAPRGRISLHITFARSHEHAADDGARLVIAEDDVWPVEGPDLTLVPPGVMIMHDYDLSRVIALFFCHGLTSIHMDRTDHGGVYGAVIHAARSD